MAVIGVAAPVHAQGGETLSYSAERHIAVYAEPSLESSRIGLIQRGTRIAASGEQRPAAGRCRFWQSVEPYGWICGRHLRPSSREPGGREVPRLSGNRVVPYNYARIPRDGVDAFASPEAAEAGEATERIRGGWIIRFRYMAGQPYIRTLRGLFIRRSEVTILFASRFVGTPIEDAGHLSRVAWPVRREARYYQAPGRRTRQRPRRMRQVQITGERVDDYVQLQDGRYLRARDIAQPTLREPPEGTQEEEPWVDVDIGEQVLVAYIGRRPVYATLISSGVGDRERRTPTGVFHVWVKHAVATMDSTGNSNPADDYSVDDIPWVQYFNGSIAFHTAYWHHSFGHRVSHGCVNLSPQDARWLFEFSGPALPIGWRSIRPLNESEGMRVRVWDSTAPPPEPAEETEPDSP